MRAAASIAAAGAVLLLASAARLPLEAAAQEASPGALVGVGALGRIEPRGGVRRIAGPPWPAVVIEELRVEKGDRVRSGQVIALLAGIGPARADAVRLRAELERFEARSRHDLRARELHAAIELALGASPRSERTPPRPARDSESTARP